MYWKGYLNVMQRYITGESGRKTEMLSKWQELWNDEDRRFQTLFN